MKFACRKHGKQEQVQHSGYSLAHHDAVPASPKYLDEINFVFDVVSNPDEGDLELEYADSDIPASYFSQFSNLEEQLARAAEDERTHECPECPDGKLMFWVKDQQRLPAVES